MTPIKDLSVGLHRHLGLEIIPHSDTHGTCLRLTVRDCHLTPFGTLSGGVMLAMEETLAGILSCERLDGQIPLGISVSANHVATARAGDTVTAHGEALHIGGTTHVWQIKVLGADGALISTATVTNYIKQIRKTVS